MSVCAWRRWGDSPLRYLQCMMFLDYRNETRKLDFVKYKHDKVRAAFDEDDRP